MSFDQVSVTFAVSQITLLYLATQMHFAIGRERVTCRVSKQSNSLGWIKLTSSLGKQKPWTFDSHVIRSWTLKPYVRLHQAHNFFLAMFAHAQWVLFPLDPTCFLRRRFFIILENKEFMWNPKCGALLLSKKNYHCKFPSSEKYSMHIRLTINNTSWSCTFYKNIFLRGSLLQVGQTKAPVTSVLNERLNTVEFSSHSADIIVWRESHQKCFSSISPSALIDRQQLNHDTYLRILGIFYMKMSTVFKSV